jgi:hypothetical protein
MAILVVHNPETPPKATDEDGIAPWLAAAETAGWEGEHVFDASVEDPPHPYWDAAKGCCKKTGQQHDG